MKRFIIRYLLLAKGKAPRTKHMMFITKTWRDAYNEFKKFILKDSNSFESRYRVSAFVQVKEPFTVKVCTKERIS